MNDVQVERLQDEQTRIFDEIGKLREARAGQEVFNSQLKDDLESLTTAVQQLTSVIDRSRGALWVISGAAGAIGAMISAVVSYLVHQKP